MGWLPGRRKTSQKIFSSPVRTLRIIISLLGTPLGKDCWGAGNAHCRLVGLTPSSGSPHLISRTLPVCMVFFPGTTCFVFKFICNALAGVAQWIECGLGTKGSPVQFPVRAHSWVAGQVPSGVHMRGNHTLMFFSLSFSFPSPFSKNKYIKS